VTQKLYWQLGFSLSIEHFGYDSYFQIFNRFSISTTIKNPNHTVIINAFVFGTISKCFIAAQYSSIYFVGDVKNRFIGF